MQTLSTRRMYAVAHLEAVLRRAGQFAHVPAPNFSMVLRDIYNPHRRFGKNAHLLADEYRSAAHDHFVKAVRAGKMEPIYDAGGTFSVLNANFGCLCPLCYHIDTRPPILSFSQEFTQFICPSFVRLVPDNPKRNTALCWKCAGSVNNWYNREFGVDKFVTTRDEITWVEALSWLVRTETFQERVKKHACNIKDLRFIPRVVQETVSDAPMPRALKKAREEAEERGLAWI